MKNVASFLTSTLAGYSYAIMVGSDPTPETKAVQESLTNNYNSDLPLALSNNQAQVSISKYGMISLKTNLSLQNCKLGEDNGFYTCETDMQGNNRILTLGFTVKVEKTQFDDERPKFFIQRKGEEPVAVIIDEFSYS